MKTHKSLSRAEGGNTMIEFALLAPIFFMLISGLVEFVLYEYKAYALNHVVYEATRNLQTGEVQTSADMAKAFHDEACANADMMIDCESIQFDVRTFDKISEITYPPVTFDEDGKPTNFVFQPGGPNKFSVVRASIHHQFITPFMDKLFHMGPDLPAIVNAYCIVKNEPFQ
jgi:Flp pilus assembly protein TadG